MYFIREESLNQTSQGKSFLILGYITLLHVCMYYLINEQIYTEEIFFQTFSDQLAVDRIREILVAKKRFQWITYLIFPLVIFLKICFVTGSLIVLQYLDSISISRKEIFRVVIIGEIVFVIRGFVRYVYFLINPPQKIEDVSSFSLSLTSVYGSDAPSYLHYALQSINVFQLMYFLLLARGIQEYTGYGFKKSFRFVSSSYGLLFFFWIVLVTFLLIQIS